MTVIKPREKAEKRITRSFRLRPDIVKKIEQIARDLNESRTYVIESLLDYAIHAHEKETGSRTGKKRT